MVMNCHNFILGPVDTDSITFCKFDQSPISKEEQISLLKEVNSLFPKLIKFDHDGYFPVTIVVRAKNYVLKTEDGKVKIKGSALKATTKEKALQEFIKKMIDLFLEDKQEEILNLYNSYVKEIYNLKEMSRWSSKKTVTDKILNPERTNEQKVLDALGDEEGIQEGDKIRVYFKSDNSLGLEQDFDGDYNKDKLLEKLYKTAEIFETIYPVKEKLLNYKLKRNKSALEVLLLHPEDKLLSKLAQTNPKLYKLILNENCKDILKPFTHLKPNETKVIEITNCPKEPVIGTLSLNWDTLNHVEWHEFLLDKIQKVINIGNSLTIVCKDKTILQNLKLHDKITIKELKTLV